MKIAHTYKKGIFCLEGDWEKDLRVKKSIKPTLEYMNKCFSIKSIYRNCAVKEQFEKYIRDYTLKKYNYFSILDLAFHGTSNSILFGKNKITLDKIAEICEGKLKNKIIHFGSCSTLNIDKRILKNFIRKTNALCLSGYKTDIDFNQGTVIDILYFETWQYYKDVRSVEREMLREYKGLVQKLEFRMVYI